MFSGRWRWKWRRLHGTAIPLLLVTTRLVIVLAVSQSKRDSLKLFVARTGARLVPSFIMQMGQPTNVGFSKITRSKSSQASFGRIVPTLVYVSTTEIYDVYD